ncbi:hypothetical protein HAX54_045785 [Datura stramonium]|uniref:Peptidase A1 domain-containing protein n=1 Tax=Datura stramonium TaxID=4076 RepID=A0ABS8SQV6_DATST|nr:hypothetical protein [Datura stramonium]
MTLDDKRSALFFRPGNGYVANISVGDPVVYKLVLIDAGSSLFWLQCCPCPTCGKQKEIPQYHRDNSLTRSKVSWSTRTCRNINGQRGELDECVYKSKYADGSVYVKTLSKETLIRTFHFDLLRVEIERLHGLYRRYLNEAGYEMADMFTMGEYYIIAQSCPLCNQENESITSRSSKRAGLIEYGRVELGCP